MRALPRPVELAGRTVVVAAALAVLGPIAEAAPAGQSEPAQARASEQTRPTGQEAVAFGEPLTVRQAVRIDGDQQQQRIRLVVHRWGRDTVRDNEREQRFVVSIASQPDFVRNLTWVDGPTVTIAPAAHSTTVTLQFDTLGAGPGGAERRAEDLVLLVRADSEHTQPGERELTVPLDFFPASRPADRESEVCVLRDDAPAEIAPVDALEYCDPDVSEPGEYDRIAIFFTPARDLREPLAERASFLWRVVNPNGDRVLGSDGVFDPNSPEESAAAASAPGRFVQVVDLWNRLDNVDPAAARSGPGRYTVQTITGGPAVTGLFGMGDATIGAATDAEWQDEVGFEVVSSRLYFQGFITEQVRDLPLPRRGTVWEGALSLGEPAVTGSHVVLDVEAWWRDAKPDARGENAAGDQLRRAASRLEIEFPVEIAPGHREMAEISSSVEPLGERDSLFFTAGMHLLVPTMKPPDRFLVAGAEPAPWAEGGALPSSYCTYGGSFSKERFLIQETVPDTANGLWIMPRESIASECVNYDLRAPWQQSDRTTLVSGERDDLAGNPGGSMISWLREREAYWALPVFVTLTSSDHAGATPPEAVRAYGYAVYASRPGRYDGPLPTGKPDTGDYAVADNDPDADSDAGAEGEDNAADAGDSDPAAGAGGAENDSDPAGRATDASGGVGDSGDMDDDDDAGAGSGTVDPTAPDISALISQWLAVAEPPLNATEGAQLRYNHRGTFVGTLRGGIITAAHDAGMSFDPRYLWDEKRSLDSVDHCTMEEYVVAALAEASIAHCLGRYKATSGTPTPDVAGQRVAAATALLEGSGFSVAPKIVGEPESEELAFTVVAQRPAAGAAIEPGGLVELDIYGAFANAAASVPDVVGMTAAEARTLLEAAGFEVAASIGGAPGSADQAYRVFEQTPAPGAQVAAGTSATLKIYSDYAATAQVPFVTGMSVDEAEAAIRAAGLSSRLMRLGTPPGAGSANRVADTSPGSGVEVAPGTEVEVRVYGDFVDPRCAALLRDGRTEAVAGNAIAALPLLREARALACDAPWLDATLADLEQAAAAFERCETLVSNGNARRQAGDLEGALVSYRQARDAGCSNGGLAAGIAELENQLSQQERNRRCNALIDQGNAARRGNDPVTALAAYRQARNEGCPDPGLDGAIAELEQELDPQNQKDRECARQIEEGNALLDAGRYEEALTAYRWALLDDCTSTPPLTQIIGDLEAALANEERNREQEEQWRREDEANRAAQCAETLRQIESARRGGDDVLVATLTIAAAIAGCDMAGVETGPIGGGGVGGGGGPAIDVNRAAESDFVGQFDLADPRRTYEQYHATVRLSADGTLHSSEWLSGRLTNPDTPGTWSFDQSTKVLTLNFRHSRFSGPVAGNTRDFVIAGRWNDNTAGQLRLTR
jgi:beta-lactam-binding protein with PASTA domain/tetratricopeptide (TPR) repeat protein